MSELAPGLFVSEYAPRGKCLVMAPTAIFPSRSVAIYPADWDLLPGETRERILDEITRTDAQRGLRMIEVALAGIGRENTGGEG